MTALEAALRRVVQDLTDAGASFALVGGLAVSARTEPRFTRDADLVVAVHGDSDAEALVHQLRARGCRIETLVEQEAVKRLATVRLRQLPPPVGPVVDLLFASSGIEREIADPPRPGVRVEDKSPVDVPRSEHRRDDRAVSSRRVRQA